MGADANRPRAFRPEESHEWLSVLTEDRSQWLPDMITK